MAEEIITEDMSRRDFLGKAVAVAGVTALAVSGVGTMIPEEAEAAVKKPGKISDVVLTGNKDACLGTLAWSKSKNATDYEVQFKVSTVGTWMCARSPRAYEVANRRMNYNFRSYIHKHCRNRKKRPTLSIRVRGVRYDRKTGKFYYGPWSKTKVVKAKKFKWNQLAEDGYWC